MDLVRALDGLDAHPWADATHAYGGAEDLPDLLRALAGDDADIAEGAVSDLYGSVLHQGTVYAASAEVAPFLARIAAAGHRTADVLLLLGGMAESEDEHGVPPGAVRAAVTAQLPLLIPLLRDADPGVRQAAAWAVAHTRAAHDVLPALRERWAEEPEPLVRAELLGALARVEAADVAVLAAELLAPDRPAQLRLAAVLASLDAGVAWGAEHHSAMLSVLPASELGGERFDLDRAEPLRWVVAELLCRGTDHDLAATADLLVAALRDERPEVVAEAAWAAAEAVRVSRGVGGPLLPTLLGLLDDADSAREVLSLLATLGPAAAAAAPALVALTTKDDADERAEGPAGGPADDLADRALVALVLVAPDRAAPLLAEGLGRRPQALYAAAGFRVPVDAPFPFDAELLTAVRARLASGGLSGNEPFQLLALLRRWGPAAAPALPELCEALASHPQPAATAVAAVAADCPPDERRRAVEALRAHADDGPLAVARALYDLTGEPTELLARLAHDLAGKRDGVRFAAVAAGELGARAQLLAESLRAALSTAEDQCVSPVLDADVAVAEALWRITGDAETVVPVLDSVFVRAAGSVWFRWSAIRAARAAALLGPAGRPLVPRLEALLADPEQAPTAVLALVAVADPDTLDRPALAGVVLTSAEQEADAQGACDALLALGGGALTADHARRLAELAERDLRVIRSGLEGEIVRNDERLRARAREVLAALG
ncbi:HEAT repeat domain-containing protein [Streptomyces sp. NBC_01275]|uniref:HEAT repeat domain-containing protein n=1 Tax=Streptomyces sp. NBC_01275 TaxID=2903807 RepID=UPI0022593CD4|nr:HEAT repeat domain-containing protein [Streptomyces sp. NBC_01275]MCX4760272.1 HEAT repeat domain-containing protein [Streptomyces sp. NBC_01275]